MNHAFAARPVDAAHVLHLARETLTLEIQALQALSDRLDTTLVEVVERILHLRGRVIVSGMGKSGHIGRKIAATLASTGTPAFFLHPGEASHGDLGMVTPEDLVIAISNSGESHELTDILPVIKRLGVPIVAMTGHRASTLGRHADWVLDTSVAREACPLNLAPTSSTTVQLALGDVLAVSLLDARGFDAQDFARSHPGGSLGRRLLTAVSDVMRQGDALPKVLPGSSFSTLMREMSAKNLGMAVVVDEGDRVLGIFTDGDLRRSIEAGRELLPATAEQLMHPQPRTIRPDALAVSAAEMMEKHHITSVLVVDEAQRLMGVLHIGDLMRAKVI